MKKIMITGAAGQIGTELTDLLNQRYGHDNVIITTNVQTGKTASLSNPIYSLDIRDKKTLEEIVSKHNIDTIFHLASLLSAKAEQNPQLAWDVNADAFMNILETARNAKCAVFFPSSIGAFGPGTPRVDTPQITIQRPNSMYGITKLCGELLCDYYHQHFAVDTRGLRYPGIISHQTLPGGGTTDYAVHMFYAALQKQHYECYLQADTMLDMMYMPDALHAAIDLMQADGEKLQHRNAYNVSAMNFTPQQLADEIKKHIPAFTIQYQVDPVRQAIADSWPDSMDDSKARNEWNWQPRYTLATMVEDMLSHLSHKLTK